VKNVRFHRWPTNRVWKHGRLAIAQDDGSSRRLPRQTSP
jgi:hypothetical protein